ncbi:hypothetical protein Pmani_027655 [Petrolisthes manimaculis]|uniref:Uncharacterized protein n=1 Tax=Petrolisthes manimaculis TaxID=1843537 RepID=A0AAE1TYU0_9EUCA|nr:hypothetical protein Pmani_027655 [Petrolisthes manimaculis]
MVVRVVVVRIVMMVVVVMIDTHATREANIFFTHNIPLMVLVVVTYTVYINAVGDRIICGGWKTLEKKVV